MKKRISLKTVLVSFLILGLSVVVFLTVHLAKQRHEIRKKAVENASLGLDPLSETYYYYSGFTFDTDIILDTGGNPIRGGDISLSFDPNYLEVVDMDPGKTGIQLTPGTILPDPWIAVNETDNTTGKILLSINTFTSFTGEGVFGTIRFKAKAPTTSTQVSFDPEPNTKITAVGGGNILGTITGGNYEIRQDNTPPSIPTLQSPPNNSFLGTRTPSFDWVDATDNETGIANYIFQVDNESNFSSPLVFSATPRISEVAIPSSSPLPADGVYYWKTRSVDLAGNSSDWSTIWSFTVDTQRPVAITNLSAGGVTTDSVTLFWAAPDAKPGTGTSYQIRYATFAITEGNWNSVSLVSNPPSPANQGTIQSKTISGLTPGSTYYFAIKTADQIGYSALSNVAQATTLQTSVRLNFSIRLEGIGTSSTPKPNVNVELALKTLGGQVIDQFNSINLIHQNTKGYYSTSGPIELTGIQPDSYQILIKGPFHLRKKVSSSLSLVRGENQADWSSTTLLAADVNNDNRVDSGDFDRLASDYVPNTPANSLADFNLDSRVDSTDFDILAGNYRKTGDPL